MEIVYVTYGIGNKIGDKIYLNKALLNYPELHNKVLEHELKHMRGDKHVDFKEPFDTSITLFFLKHPSAWCQILPIWFIGNKIIYCKIMAWFWAFVIAWIYLLVMVGRWMI